MFLVGFRERSVYLKLSSSSDRSNWQTSSRSVGTTFVVPNDFRLVQ